MKKSIALLLVLAWFIPVLSSRASDGGDQLWANDQILVKMKNDAVAYAMSAAQYSDEWLLGRGTKAEALETAEPNGTYLVQLNGTMSVEAAIELAELDPRVEYAEPNYLCYTTETRPNDPMFNEMWNLYNAGPDSSDNKAGADIGAIKAWDITTGSSDVVVAVIDTGVYLDHADLAANAWVNPGEVAGNGRDDDGNGFVDDVNGWNFQSGNNQVYTDPTNDRHGTHVSGTIGATGNNGVGVTGVAWRVKLMGLKFLGGGPSSIDGAIRAINYAIDQKRRGANVRVINASWIASGESRALHDAIVAAGNADILFVCGAGNGGSDSVGDDLDSAPVYPAAYTDIPSLISVAAVDYADNLATFSNFGRRSVSVAAPGVSIVSTYPENGYGYMKGTSMATPHVSGIAALIAAREPRLTAADIKVRIIATAEPVPSLAGKVVAAGRANAYNALRNASPSVGQPVVTSVETTKKVVSISGTGFVSGSMVVEVNAAPLPAPKYDSSSRVANGSYTRMTIKLSKSNMKSVFPAGVQVSVTVLNTSTGERSAAFLFARN